jgi:hypothetical protein
MRDSWVMSSAPQEDVTSEDLEALREGLDVVTEEEVVCKHTTDLGDDFSLATSVDKVKGGCPTQY